MEIVLLTLAAAYISGLVGVFVFLLYGLWMTGVGFQPIAALRIAVVWPYWILVWLIGGTVV